MSIISCIGSGNMGLALMSAAARCDKNANIYLSDIDNKKAQDAAESIGAKVCYSNHDAAGNGHFIFLAVKPQALADILNEISPIVKKRLSAGITADAPVIVSMAAGWSIKKIQEVIGEKIPVVRIMPNTPALIGMGMIVMAVSSEVPQSKIEELEKILGAAGLVDKIDEHYMDAATGLSGSGPAFVYLFIEALADGAVRAGLPRDKSIKFAAQTVAGAAQMVQKTGKHPGELKDMVTSPGGTTIAGIAALENGAFRGTVIKAVEAAWKRSIELG
ncbi:MAG: pyrroline-5-carboxylate reductase [Treponema sp.]|nr:pyrroline-5-carboxylate reductase [Treponema sp.]